MPWGAAIGAIGSVAAASMSDGGGGGGGQSSQSSNTPWANAQPWLVQNLNSGYGLQQRMEADPFSAQQQQAYQNQANQGQYMRALTPSLLGQLSSQQVGFDRSNPNYRPPAFNFDGNTGMGDGVSANAYNGGGGLLSMLGAGNATNSSIPAEQAAPAPEAAKPEEPKFVNQSWEHGQMPDFKNITEGTKVRLAVQNSLGNGGDINAHSLAKNPSLSVGQYGTFKYGDKAPQPGSKAHQDMSLYFANGGTDPANLYGKGKTVDPWWIDGGGA